MKFGIYKRQWIYLALLELLPVVSNGAGVINELGWNVFSQLLHGEKYAAYQIVFEDAFIDRGTLLTILLFLLVISTILATLSWGITALTNRKFFQRQPAILRWLEYILITNLLTWIYVIVCGRALPIGWLSALHDYRWFPFSQFMYDVSFWIIMPVVVILLFFCFRDSYIHNLDETMKQSIQQ
jgi:hypothetical protein